MLRPAVREEGRNTEPRAEAPDQDLLEGPNWRTKQTAQTLMGMNPMKVSTPCYLDSLHVQNVDKSRREVFAVDLLHCQSQRLRGDHLHASGDQQLDAQIIDCSNQPEDTDAPENIQQLCVGGRAFLG